MTISTGQTRFPRGAARAALPAWMGCGTALVATLASAQRGIGWDAAGFAALAVLLGWLATEVTWLRRAGAALAARADALQAALDQSRRAEERVRYFAQYDDLTKLVNRNAFGERLGDAMALADDTRRGLAVLYLDLDGFKAINDTHGHAGGDALLMQVGARMRAAVRDTDTVARVGGDEFAIVQPLVDRPDAALALAGRVIRAVAQPYMLDGTACRVGVSVGIALYPDHAADAPALLRVADTALYRAKRDGGGLARVFHPALDRAPVPGTAVRWDGAADRRRS